MARFLWRALMRASPRNVWVFTLRTVAILYQVGFAFYLPVSRYATMSAPPKYRWFGLFALSFLLDKLLANVPKKAAKRWELVDTQRLKATGVAISLMKECMRKNTLTEADFGQIARGLLIAIRFDVETLVVDQTGFYINASLLVEDRDNVLKLRVVARANADRPNRSYLKKDLFIATVLSEPRVWFESNFEQADKPYKSIMAIPLVLEGATQSQTIGIISIDSGRRGEFDRETADSLEERLSPYVNLLGMLLVMQTALRKETDGSITQA